MIIGQVDRTVNRSLHAVCRKVAVYPERILEIGILRLLLKSCYKEVITYAQRYSGGYHLLDFGGRDKRFRIVFHLLCLDFEPKVIIIYVISTYLLVFSTKRYKE
jgi:hypothetical protein